MSLFVVGSRWKWLGLSALLWFAMPTAGWAQVYAPSMGPTQAWVSLPGTRDEMGHRVPCSLYG